MAGAGDAQGVEGDAIVAQHLGHLHTPIEECTVSTPSGNHQISWPCRVEDGGVVVIPDGIVDRAQALRISGTQGEDVRGHDCSKPP